MKSMTVEANETADIHLDVRQKLTGSSLESIKHWKNSNYQKTFVKWKQTAAAQEGFDKVQRPWAKRFLKVSFNKMFDFIFLEIKSVRFHWASHRSK